VEDERKAVDPGEEEEAAARARVDDAPHSLLGVEPDKRPGITLEITLEIASGEVSHRPPLFLFTLFLHNKLSCAIFKTKLFIKEK
jgi:hypothetical protein